MSEIGINQLKEDLQTHGFFYVAKRAHVNGLNLLAADWLDFRYFKDLKVGLSLRDAKQHELVTDDRLTRLAGSVARKYGLDSLILECQLSYVVAGGYVVNHAE